MDSRDGGKSRRVGEPLFHHGKKIELRWGGGFLWMGFLFMYIWEVWLQNSKRGSKGRVYTSRGDFDLWFTNVESATDQTEKECKIWEPSFLARKNLSFRKHAGVWYILCTNNLFNLFLTLKLIWALGYPRLLAFELFKLWEKNPSLLTLCLGSHYCQSGLFSLLVG